MAIALPSIPPLDLLQVNSGVLPNDGQGDSLPTFVEKFNFNMNKLSQHVRFVLRQPITLYVSPGGNDEIGNRGLDLTRPLRTIGRAMAIAYSDYDLNGYSITIRLAGGNYTESLALGGLPYGGRPGRAALILDSYGQGAQPHWLIPDTANCALFLTDGADVLLRNVHFASASPQLDVSRRAVTALREAVVRLNGTTFCHLKTTNLANSQHIWAEQSNIKIEGPYNITGGAQNHIALAWGSYLESCVDCGAAINNTVTNTPAFSHFLSIRNASRAWVPFSSTRWVGNASGVQFVRSWDSEIVYGDTSQTYNLPANLTAGIGETFQVTAPVNFQFPAVFQESVTFRDTVAFEDDVAFAKAPTSATPSVNAPDQTVPNMGWVKSYATPLIAAVTLPIGSLVLTAAATEPDNRWLFCNGRELSRVTFSALFGIIGTTYGVGNGTETFNIPDFRGRSPIGEGTAPGLSARALGSRFGAEVHSLTQAEMPWHTHQINDPGHTHGVNDPGHRHAIWAKPSGREERLDGFTGDNSTAASDDGPHTYLWDNGVRTIIHPQATGIWLSGSGTGTWNSASGGSGSHNNMHPVIVCNFLIRAR